MKNNNRYRLWSVAGIVAVLVVAVVFWQRSRREIAPLPAEREMVSQVRMVPPDGVRDGETMRVPPVAVGGRMDAAAPPVTPPQTTVGRPPVVEALLGADGTRLTLPPFASKDGRPATASPHDSTIQGLAHDIATASGPEAAEHARSLILAGQEGVGVVGAALLADLPEWAWDEALYDAVANHTDMAVPLFALQALRDAGRDSEADNLQSRLLTRMGDGADWLALVQNHAIPGTALRALVSLSRTLPDAEQRADLMSAVAAMESADYGARMRALLELRENMPFEEFRTLVRQEAGNDATGAPDIWQMGVERLASRLEGPAEVHTGPTVLAVSDVQVMVAQEYPAMYEDLALHLEMLTGSGTALFGTGVQTALEDLVKNAASHPISDDEMRAVRRIELLVEQIVETDITNLVPPPPPGS